MSFVQRGRMPLDYAPVVYPGSTLLFRGPGQTLDDPYVLCLGGSETFGRFIGTPFAAQLRAALPDRVVNMGVMNAGLDVLTTDPAITRATRRASAIVLQIVGAQNMSNRFYSVHPRRNDRFVKARKALRQAYPEVDFTEFHFTRHLLGHLKSLSAGRFRQIEAELQAVWLHRMGRFLDQARAPVHLLWLSRRAPGSRTRGADLGCDPLFVTRAMLDRLRPAAASLAIAVPDGGPDRGTGGMYFAGPEEPAARVLPGPEAHAAATAALVPHLTGCRA